MRILRIIRIYINFGNKNRIRIVWPCSNAVKHTSLTYSIENWQLSSCCQNFDESNKSNNWKNEEGANWYWVTEQNAGPEIIKMLLTSDDRMHKKKTMMILLKLTSLRITKASWWAKFSKKVTRWLFDDCSIVPNEKLRRSFLK